MSDNPIAYWRLSEAGGNLAHDYVGGHDCLFTNVQLGVAGYSAFDPNTAAGFGLLAASNSCAGELDNSSNGIANLDFSQPSGSSAEFSVEAWGRGNAQTQDAGIVTKGYLDDDAGPNSSSAFLPGAWGAYSNLANPPYMTQQCGP